MDQNAATFAGTLKAYLGWMMNCNLQSSDALKLAHTLPSAAPQSPKSGSPRSPRCYSLWDTTPRKGTSVAKLAACMSECAVVETNQLPESKLHTRRCHLAHRRHQAEAHKASLRPHV
eukprot:CAMPEP_0178459694 /NCGR_PEP_ID=MMETSP0689_2-20121128/48274_1 /TAXON_ID=160604 /ORGANISM="Amphidinium massartii, Strain CS-259" /LENGTH=116 /DNA_ID=CAMNT_0020086203 /DNA_START=40 /DNA_END=391 /DNA_ORIENTATION=+